jgi:hypothetical protein
MSGWSLSNARAAAGRRAVAMVCALAAGVLGWLSVEPGGSQSASAATSAAVSETRSALQKAAASGQRVEVEQKRTDDSQTFVNPDGTFTLEQSAVPVRTKQNGQWVDLDATLSQGSDGMIRPRAAAMEMAFSGGGAGPLAVLISEGKHLQLTWPSPLPEPSVEGDGLTYSSVYPGVDLRINITTQSFSQVLIVHSLQAALQPQLEKVRLGLNAVGLQLQRTAGGGVEAVDGVGQAIFSAPKPTMWDSRGDRLGQPATADRAAEPLEGDNVAAMPVEISQGSLAVTPIRSIVQDPATVYPLHVDPAFSAGRTARSMINQHYPTTPTWGWGGDEGVGYQSYEPWSRKRLLFGFGVSQIAGSDVLSAVFSAYETWSASCTPRVVEVWKLGRFTDTTNWSNGSGSTMWQQKLGYATAAHGRDGCDPGGYWVPFGVKSAVDEVAAARGTTVYLGMRAADENDQLAWKRFRYDVKLSITYNFPPTVLDPHTIDPATKCVTTSASDPEIGDATPIPVVSITDPDTSSGDQVRADFEIRRAVDQAPFWQGSSPTKQGGASVDFSPTSVPTLWSNTTYVWRARAYDGKSYSAWSANCLFYVDTSKPPAPSVTVQTAAPYTLDNSVTIKFGPNGATDVSGYRYAINDDAPGATVVSASTATITTTPSAFGPWTVRAWSVDKAGNLSAGPGEQTIRVDGTPPIGLWPMDEGTGTSTVDTSGHGRLMYLGPTVSWVYGNKALNTTPTDYALYLPGLQTSGATTATAASNIVDASQNFSVAALVKLDIKSNRQVIVSEDRPGTSGFALGTNEMTWIGKDTADTSDDDQNDRKVKWNFTVATNNGPFGVTSDWIAYDAADWAHVTGVFTKSTGRLDLYVNGVWAVGGTLPAGSSVADGTGPFRTGLSIDNSATTNFFRGFIEDVYLYNGRVDDNLIQALASDGLQ